MSTKPKVLFDHENRLISDDGRSAYSNILHIPVGKVALLSLYNMYSEIRMEEDNGKTELVSNDCAVVRKLSLGGTGDVARKVACDEYVDIISELRGLLCNRRVFHEPVYQCGKSWTLNPCNNFALLTVPGFYILEFFNPNQFDTAYVEYELISVADSLAIPNAFKLGG